MRKLGPGTVALITALSFAGTTVAVAQQQQQGTASYYTGGQNGKTITKSGEPVNPQSNTAASPNLPLGSTAKVTNQKTGQSTNVRITDRGPTPRKARKGRVIDLSKKSANDIGISEKSGTAPVTVKQQ